MAWKCIWKKFLVCAALSVIIAIMAMVAWLWLTNRTFECGRTGCGQGFSVRMLKDDCLELYLIVYPKDRVIWIRGVGIFKLESKKVTY